MLFFVFVVVNKCITCLFVFLPDYSKGFGGKFGVQKENQDKSALGYGADTHTELHPSQTDMKKGFGGKFGVEQDRRDKVWFNSLTPGLKHAEWHKKVVYMFQQKIYKQF